MRVKKKPSVEKTEGIKVLSDSFSSLTAAEFSDTKGRRKTDGNAGDMRFGYKKGDLSVRNRCCLPTHAFYWLYVIMKMQGGKHE